MTDDADITKDLLLPDESPTVVDGLKRVGKAAISLIPGVGGASSELLAKVLQPSYEKRLGRWREAVVYAFNVLDKRLQAVGRSLEELQDNEVFNTTVHQATEIAMRNHQQEKIEALRNAVISSGLPGSPDESLQTMFLSYVDQFTVWHIRLLDLFNGQREWAARHNHRFPELHSAGLSNILTSAYPELGDRRDFYDLIWKDLFQKGLVNTDSLHGMMTGSSLLGRRTSQMGQQFLIFISEPVDD